MNTDVVELKTINEVGLLLDPETFSRVILDFLGVKKIYLIKVMIILL